ncbi:hypothetical protein B0H13DRAFT_1930887 [Mycena leptocephala]|nr:hypothetical protein B0H13DRAFT_1930887 [Mycena leptocephala]
MAVVDLGVSGQAAIELINIVVVVRRTAQSLVAGPITLFSSGGHFVGFAGAADCGRRGEMEEVGEGEEKAFGVYPNSNSNSTPTPSGFMKHDNFTITTTPTPASAPSNGHFTNSMHTSASTSATGDVTATSLSALFAPPSFPGSLPTIPLPPSRVLPQILPLQTPPGRNTPPPPRQRKHVMMRETRAPPAPRAPAGAGAVHLRIWKVWLRVGVISTAPRNEEDGPTSSSKAADVADAKATPPLRAAGKSESRTKKGKAGIASIRLFLDPRPAEGYTLWGAALYYRKEGGGTRLAVACAQRVVDFARDFEQARTRARVALAAFSGPPGFLFPTLIFIRTSTSCAPPRRPTRRPHFVHHARIGTVLLRALKAGMLVWERGGDVRLLGVEFLSGTPVDTPLSRASSPRRRQRPPPSHTSLDANITTTKKSARDRDAQSWCGPRRGLDIGWEREDFARDVGAGWESWARDGVLSISTSVAHRPALAPVPVLSARERGQEQERERAVVARSASTPAVRMFSARAAGNIFTRLSHWGVGVISSFREEKEEVEEGERTGKRGRGSPRCATLSASSSRPWALVGSGSSGSLASEVSEFVAREGEAEYVTQRSAQLQNDKHPALAAAQKICMRGLSHARTFMLTITRTWTRPTCVVLTRGTAPQASVQMRCTNVLGVRAARGQRTSLTSTSPTRRPRA